MKGSGDLYCLTKVSLARLKYSAQAAERGGGKPVYGRRHATTMNQKVEK